jgi:hypothetical protein
MSSLQKNIQWGLSKRPALHLETTDETVKMNTFHFHNSAHIGDNLLNLKYFLSVARILKEKKCKIYYYYDTGYLYNKKEKLMQYVDPELIELNPLSERPSDSIQLWMADPKNGLMHEEFEKYFEQFYLELSKCLNIENLNVNNTLWLEEDYLLPVYEALDPQFKDIDILILNNLGMSSQYNNNKSLNQLCHHLHSKFNIVTLGEVGIKNISFIKNISGIKNASGLTLKQIGAMSTRAKYIITPNSGALIPCLNSYTKNYVKKWFFVGRVYSWYTIDHVQCGTDVTPIKEYFDSL